MISRVLISITVLLFFSFVTHSVAIVNKQSIITDSIQHFYIIDTIEISSPKLLYVSERVNSMDKFTPILLNQQELNKINFSKIKKAEQFLLNYECFIFNNYDDLKSILRLMKLYTNQPTKNGLQVTTDSCLNMSKTVTSCGLKGLNKKRFIIAILDVKYYNYYRVMEHKILSTEQKFVMIAFPFE